MSFLSQKDDRRGEYKHFLFPRFFRVWPNPWQRQKTTPGVGSERREYLRRRLQRCWLIRDVAHPRRFSPLGRTWTILIFSRSSNTRSARTTFWHGGKGFISDPSRPGSDRAEKTHLEIWFLHAAQRLGVGSAKKNDFLLYCYKHVSVWNCCIFYSVYLVFTVQKRFLYHNPGLNRWLSKMSLETGTCVCVCLLA